MYVGAVPRTQKIGNCLCTSAPFYVHKVGAKKAGQRRACHGAAESWCSTSGHQRARKAAAKKHTKTQSPWGRPTTLAGLRGSSG